MIKFSSIAAASAISLGLIGQAAAQTVFEVAKSGESFHMLTAAITTAGLAQTLSGDGPFTLFAPTDEAFAEIPRDERIALLKDKAKLQKVLSQHVLDGKVMAADVKEGTVKSYLGQTLTITTGDAVKVEDATVVRTDIPASNGVVHVIDKVILPR